MVAEVAGWTLALVLAGAALLKLRDPARSQAALATYGLRGAGVRRGAWIAVVTAELALAIGLGLGSSVADYLAGALFAGFALALAAAMARGRRGEPCGCFGGRSRVGPGAIARAAGLAAARAAGPPLPGAWPTRTGGAAPGPPRAPPAGARLAPAPPPPAPAG